MPEKIPLTFEGHEGPNTFVLNRKPVELGAFAFNQYWMPIESVYPTNGRNGRNYPPLVNLWWTACQQHGTDRQRSQREAYLLLQLLPRTRSKGSNRIVADATLQRSSRLTIPDLNDLLKPPYPETEECSFRKTIADALGVPTPTDEDHERYREAVAELFDEGCRLLLSGETRAAVEVVENRWNDWTTRYGRRRGHAERKKLLDTLPYEARAALHQCYAAVWDWLIRFGLQEEWMSEASVAFHSLWHLEHRGPAEGRTDADVHLFAGHIFALHPATGMFIQTAEGQRLIGEYLAEPRSMTTQGALLDGIAIAVHHYSLARSAANDDRHRRPLSIGGSTEWVEENQVERSRGNLRRESLGAKVRPGRKKAR